MGCDVALDVRSPQGNHVDGVEFRSVRREDGTILAYVNNLRRRNRRLRLMCTRPIKSVRNLSLAEPAGRTISLPAMECYLLQIETE